jgi:hypothetical protein
MLHDLIRCLQESADGPFGAFESEALHQALTHLSTQRIVRRIGDRDNVAAFSLHDVVRNHISQWIPSERRANWHTEIAAFLAAKLEGEAEPEDKAHFIQVRLDEWEDIVFHLVRGTSPMEAFLTYWEKMGNFGFLGHGRSDYARGERVCRTLNLDSAPEAPPDYLVEDGRGGDVALLTDWGLYFLFLGEIPQAKQTFLASYWSAGTRTSPQRPIAAQNVAEACLTLGDLRGALEWADSGAQHAGELLDAFEGVPTAEVMRGYRENMGTAVLSQLLSGDINKARETLDGMASLYRQAAAAHQALARTMVYYPPIPSGELDLTTISGGLLWARYLLSKGALSEARRVAEQRLGDLPDEDSEDVASMRLRETLASTLIELGEIDAAVQHVRAMADWASVHGSAMMN